MPKYTIGDAPPKPNYTIGDAPVTPTTGASISAAKPESWLDQVHDDLLHGGGRTIVGRALGHIEGNGDKGYQGLESGVSPAAAQYMGSPELGAVKMATGITETPQHPLMGPVHALEGGLQMLTIPSMMTAPEVNPAMKGGARLLDLVPTRAKAGRIFEDVMNVAKDQPVKISPATMQPLERTQQLAMAGGKPFSTADKLYQRIQGINPLTYGEARDFSSNMSLSPEEKMALKRSMKYEVPRLSNAFNSDVQKAADDAGVGAQHAKAMKMYRQGARLEAAGKGALKYGGRALLGAIGAGGLYELGRAVNGK